MASLEDKSQECWRKFDVVFYNTHRHPSRFNNAIHRLEFFENLPEEFEASYASRVKKSRNMGFRVLILGRGDNLSEEESQRLLRRRRGTPRFVSRITGLGKIHPSTGSSSPAGFLSNADRHAVDGYDRLVHMTKQDAANMMIVHLLWKNPVDDQFLSFTHSFIFEVSHMLRRAEQGQAVHKCFGDITKLQRPDGSAVEAFRALDLLRAFPQEYADRLSLNEQGSVEERHVAQEILSFGEMEDPTEAMIWNTLQNLMENGLGELCPEMIVTADERRVGLYRHQVALKCELFYDVKGSYRITQKDLVLAYHLAGLSKSTHKSRPRFMEFVKYVGCRKRPDENPLFGAWVKEHLIGSDILECIYKDMHKIPSNLPDVIQHIKLLQEAVIVLEVEKFPQETVEEMTHDISFVNEKDIYSFEDRYFYRKTRARDELENILLDRDCYQDNDEAREEREYLSRTLSETEHGWKIVHEEPQFGRVEHILRKDGKTKVAPNAPMAQWSVKMKFIDVEPEELLSELETRAGGFQRMKRAREEMEEWHATFERDVKPDLTTQLAPEESWD